MAREASRVAGPCEGDALLVVDVQNDFMPGGALGVRDGDRVIAPLNRTIERRRVAGSVECRADAEAVDRRPCGQRRRDAVLVEIAAGEDVHVMPLRGVEHGANGLRVRGNVAAVEVSSAFMGRRP